MSKPPVFRGLTDRKIREAALPPFGWAQFRRNEKASSINVTFDNFFHGFDGADIGGRISRRSWFKQTPAVCVPPGARLLLRDIPKDLQRQLDVQAIEEVTFLQLSAEAYQYRDAVRFRNGREVLLQRLKYGQRVEVLDLCSDDTREADHQRREEEYRRIFVG